MIRALILALCIASPVMAQPICGKRADLVAKLAITYDEAPVGRGMTQGSMVEVFTSATGSWTLAVTQPDGTMCLIVAGQGWQDVPQGVDG